MLRQDVVSSRVLLYHKPYRGLTLQDEEDLRTEIYSLRKHIARVCSENQILKVKIRKLQDEMIKRDKQLDEFLNSKRVNSSSLHSQLQNTKHFQFFGFSKNSQDKGASVLMNLKLKNDKLEQSLLEKDMMIKRLQNTLQTAKLYNAHSFNKKYASKGTFLFEKDFAYVVLSLYLLLRTLLILF